MAQNLADLQAALQQDILTGSSHTINRLSVPEKSAPQARLQVYKNAYVLRLEEILGHDFDTVWTYLGDDLFHELAVQYIHECPSNNPNVRWFSHRFPEFLSKRPVAAEHPVVPEMALIERALSDAFDAHDATHLSLEDLAKLPAEDVVNATFALHPSVNLIKLTTNACDIFRAMRADENVPAATTLAEPAWALVWRWDWTSRYMSLDPEEGALLDLLRQGHSFSRLCEMAAVMDDPDTAAIRMAGYLQRWAMNGFLLGHGA